MKRTGQPSDHGERGASLVEFALVLGLLLILLGGVMDIGRAFNSYIVITNAAREGARYASHFPHYARGIRDATIQEAANSGVILVDANILISPEPPVGAAPGDPGVAQPGSPIRVGVRIQIPTILGGIVGFNLLTLRSATDMVVFGLDQS